MKKLALLVAGLTFSISLFGQQAEQKPSGPPPAAAPRPAAPRPLPKIEFEKFTLPNGLQVILHVDRKLPIVHVNEWFHVGSKNEQPRPHRLRAPVRAPDVPGLEERARRRTSPSPSKAGANIREGGVNGTTNNDRTNYFATVPSGNLETAALARVRSHRHAR